MRLGREENIRISLVRFEAGRRDSYPQTGDLRAVLDDLKNVDEAAFEEDKRRFDAVLNGGDIPPMHYLCKLFIKVSEAIDDPTKAEPELAGFTRDDLLRLRMTAAYYILLLS